MVKLKLFCAIVGVAGDPFSVKVDESETADALKKVILERKKKKLLYCEDPDDLQLFLAKTKDGAWLSDDDTALDAVQQSGAVPEKMPNLLNEQIDPAAEIADIFVPAPRTEEIHVLVVAPKVESLRPVSEEVQWKNLLNALEWKDPKRLCGSDGCDWPYQGAEELSATLLNPLVQHYNAWKDGIVDKQTHALNLVLSGTGTGKSRMLDEMKNLLCDAAARSKDQDLMERMENAYVFRVTFENGTAPLGSLLAEKNPEFDVSYRMLYQLAKDRKDWPAFVFELKQSYTKLPLYIEMVIEILAELKKVDKMEDMTVILCVDGLQKLVDDGTKKCDFYRVLAVICRFLNSSRAFAVCVCSATVQAPVDQALSYSHQKRVYLLPPVLRGREVLKPRTRLEEQLVDDMGGHGRALETLGSVLRQYTKDQLEQTDPADIVDQVCSQLRLQYGDIFAFTFFQDPANCQVVLAAILSRRRYGVFECVAPDMTVDRLRSFGMIRWTPDRTIECAFILLQMLLRTLPKTACDLNKFNEQLTRTMWGLQQFEQFVAFYRRVKSMVYCGAPVNLSTFHSGARFGPIDGIRIKELQPRTVVEPTTQQVSRSGSGDSLLTKRHDAVKVSQMGTIVVNGASDSAGDISMRIQLMSGNKETVCNEVIQCKLMQMNQKMNKIWYEEERAKAVDVNTDVFLLITTSDDVVDPFDLPERCGIVSKGEFDQYFGAFASRAHRSLLDPPNINIASDHELRLVDGVGDATAKKVIADRKTRRFLSDEDAVSQPFSKKKCKTAEVLRALHCDDVELTAITPQCTTRVGFAYINP